MNRIIIIYALLFSMLFQLEAQKAEVYVFHPKAYSSALLNIQILIDDKQVGVLGYGERLVYSTSEFGNHKIEFKMVNAKNELLPNIHCIGQVSFAHLSYFCLL